MPPPTTQESQMSANLDQPFPSLQAAKSQNLEVYREYKSGAKYQGEVRDNKKTGRGVFCWPNGDQYEGEFMDNVRNGQGTQMWADGSKYEGEFVNDMRHGNGTHSWANGEKYSGDFYLDRRHGRGTYIWPDGSSYSGYFFMDKKESYGKFTFVNKNVFEGLYKDDEREGPGVVTYPDGAQDVGLWHREKLVKLCVSVEGAFTMVNHKEFDYVASEHIKTIDINDIHSQKDVINGIVAPPQTSSYPPEVDISHQTSSIFSDSLDKRSLAADLKTFHDVFFHDAKTNKPSAKVEKGSGEISEDNKVLAWNNTPSLIAMQKHILRHQFRESSSSCDVLAILNSNRSKFGKPGPIEKASVDFLQASLSGNTRTVTEYLNNEEVCANVADKNGHTALLGAAINWHKDIINCLLDNGANVNKLNDEGISALAACHVFFYPVDKFKYNIAERYLDCPPEWEREAGYDVNEAVKSILSSPRKKQPAPQQKQGNQLDLKKIHKYREEFSGKEIATLGENEMENGNLDSEVDRNLSSPMSESDRKLGTLQVKRVKKVNIVEELTVEYEAPESLPSHESSDKQTSYDGTDSEMTTVASEFESGKSIKNLRIDVTDQLIERCATQLSTNTMVVDRTRSAVSMKSSIGTARKLAMDKAHEVLMESTIQLLLKRGADPNASQVPMPVLFFAVKAADVEAVTLLLMKGARPDARLSETKGGLQPLHIAVAIPGEEGVQITKLLLDSLGDPDARAAEDDSFLNKTLEDEWSKDVIDEDSRKILGGRTPVHIACARDDNYRNACRVVHMLLDHHANANLLCNGHSPLTLAISSGNDLAIDELLQYGANPCLPLTHGVGNALCMASSTEYEHRRDPAGRIKLIDKLIKAGADILAPVAVGPKRVVGTAVDYAYHMYNLDRRIAHMPYHALSHAERETFNARKKLLSHVGDILRTKFVEQERTRTEEDMARGLSSASQSGHFVFTGAGASVPPGIMKGKEGRGLMSDSRVSFRKSPDGDGRKPQKFCYECGRSVGVRLAPCTRCKEVFYCSKACKMKAWNARHKEECIRIGGRSGSPSPGRGGNRVDSPTPATDPEKGSPTTIHGMLSGDPRIKFPPINNTPPNTFMKPSRNDHKKTSGHHKGGTYNDGSKYGRKPDNTEDDLSDDYEGKEYLEAQPMNDVNHNIAHERNRKNTNHQNRGALNKALNKGQIQGKKSQDHSTHCQGGSHKIYPSDGYGEHGTRFTRPGRSAPLPRTVYKYGAMVPLKGRSQSAQVPGDKYGGRGRHGAYRNGHAVPGDGLKSQSLPGGQFGWVMVDGKHVYIDNYSFV